MRERERSGKRLASQASMRSELGCSTVRIMFSYREERPLRFETSDIRLESG
jgi:hypothetical protein